MSRRVDSRLLWLGLVVVVVLAAFFSASRRRSGPPFDPRSTDDDGARGVVVLLEDLGTDVDITDRVPATGDGDTVFVLDDRMPRDQADAVRAYAAGGGTVVVADPSSLLSPSSVPLTGSNVAGSTVRGSCDDGSLPDVRTLAVEFARGFAVAGATAACFVADGAALVVSRPTGRGRIVSIGAPLLFTNAFLGEADNAVLAAAVLGQAERLTFLTPAASAVGSGDDGLLDLVPTPVVALLWQGVVVFGVAVWWRARRLGDPVAEPQPVAIAGSELTRAVGRLLEANGRPDRAAALLRERARVDLGPRLGLGPDAGATAVAAALAAATSLSPSEIEQATVAPVTTDHQLLTVARLLSRIREEVLHELQPSP